MGLKNVNTQSWSVSTPDPALKVTQTGEGLAADFDGAVAATVVGGARDILSQAVWWVDAQQHDGGQTVRNLGWGGSVLNATAGSGTGVDSNDPQWLPWSGQNYVYLPGVSGNYLGVPDSAALDITGDIDIRLQMALDDWTPSANQQLISKWEADGPTNSWYLRLNTDGKLTLTWAPTNGTSAAATSSVATSVTDGSVKWIRATLDVDNGASGNDVKFWTSDDGTTWTQLGTTVTQSGTTQIYAGTGRVIVGSIRGDVEMLAGKVFRAQVLNGINGTPVLDVDTSLITSGSNTSFTALTGQTVTINRSTSGRKTVAVTTPCWLFGTDDYINVSDDNLLDFTSTESFTVIAAFRSWGNESSGMGILAKKNDFGTNAGYNLYQFGTIFYGRIADGTNSTVSSVSNVAGSLVTAAHVRNVSTDNNSLTLLNTTDTDTDTTTGTLANSDALRIGALPGGSGVFSNMELIAAAIFRRVLTPSEIAKITAYYAKRGPSYVQDHVIQGDLVVTGALGYGTGAGGTVTQGTSKATSVTLNKPTGQITLHNATLNAATTVSFTLNNSTIAATDMILVQHISAGTVGAYACTAAPAAGSATIYVTNRTAGNLGEAIVLQYAVIKAATS